MVTDLPKEQAEVAWDRMRFWIEDEYNDHKSGGWGWEQTKMQDPRRAERLWLAMAVAMPMVVLVGGQEEAEERTQKRKVAEKRMGTPRCGRPPKPLRRPRGREQSGVMRGQQALHAAVVRGADVPRGHGVAEAWPTETPAVGKPATCWRKKRTHKEAVKRSRQNKHAREKQMSATNAEALGGRNERTTRRFRSVQRREQRAHERGATRQRVEAQREERTCPQEEPQDRKQRKGQERMWEQERKRERRV